MSGLQASAIITAATSFAITASATKTILAILAPTTQRIKVKKWGISFDSTTALTPVDVEIVRFSASAGGFGAPTSAGTGTALTPVSLVPLATGEAINTTSKYNFTAEPTVATVLWNLKITPQAGWQEFFPIDQDALVPGGTMWGIRYTSAPSVTPKVSAGIWFDE